MKTIDLHTHSYYSDGEDSPRILLKTAFKEGFNVFSIADHNYISSDQKDLQKLAEKQGMLFIQGIELSCIDRETKESLHVLGYSNCFNIEKINERLLTIIEGYNNRAKKIIKKLNRKYNAGFDFDRIKNEIRSICVSRNHIAQKLSRFLDNRVTPRELLSEVFVEENNSWMLDPKEAIEIISENNGIAILAHPGNLVYKDYFESLIERLVDSGLKGIEAYSPKNSFDVIDILRKIAEKFDLIITGGSDWHGRGLSEQEWGVLVPDRVCNKLSELFIQEKPSSVSTLYSSMGLK